MSRFGMYGPAGAADAMASLALLRAVVKQIGISPDAIEAVRKSALAELPTGNVAAAREAQRLIEQSFP